VQGDDGAEALEHVGLAPAVEELLDGGRGGRAGGRGAAGCGGLGGFEGEVPGCGGLAAVLSKRMRCLPVSTMLEMRDNESMVGNMIDGVVCWVSEHGQNFPSTVPRVAGDEIMTPKRF
jgi:hypothetical protein